MNDSILTRPYQQNAAYIALAPREVALSGGGWDQVVGLNTQRYAFIVENGTGPTTFVLSPTGTGDISPPVTKTGSLPVIIHGAAWPLFVTGVWFVGATAPGTVIVTELLRREGA